MIALFKKLFAKNTPSKPLLRVGQRITIIKRIGARKVYSNEYVSIESDMILIYKGENDNKLFFEVRTNYHPAKHEAHDKDMVYFYKPNFKKLKYRNIKTY